MKEARDESLINVVKYLATLALICFEQEGYTLAREFFMDCLEYWNESDSGNLVLQFIDSWFKFIVFNEGDNRATLAIHSEEYSDLLFVIMHAVQKISLEECPKEEKNRVVNKAVQIIEDQFNWSHQFAILVRNL